MKRIIVCYCFIQAFSFMIPSTDAQRSLQQYLQLSGLPYSTVQLPATTYIAAPNPINNDNVPANQVAQQRPVTGLPAFSALSLPNLIAELSHKTTEKPLAIHTETSQNIDAKLLNNLAIALQLLIVSNIMNSPPPEIATEKAVERKAQPILSSYNPTDITHSPPIQAQYYISQEQLNPVANFKNYAEPKTPSCQPSRRSLSLIKSPYEALASSSYTDPISQYSALNSRRDLKSPYAMIDKDMNLFSMNDLF